MSNYRSGTYRFSQPQKSGPHHALARKLGISAAVVLVLGAIFAVVAGLVFWFWQYNYGSEHNVTFKIAQVVNISTGSSGHEYDVYTGQGRVLMNSDTLLHGKSDSANVQAWLTAHQGQVVTCPVYGYRVFVLSSKMNVLDGCKVATPGTPQNY